MGSVRLDHLFKKFDEKTVAVRDVTLTIEDREFVVFVGPSGCGKSTILRMIAGLEEITEGNIYIDGTLVNGVPPKDRDIAMVFQNYALYPHMTVFENLAFGLKMRSYTKSDIQQRVGQAADILGITQLLDRKPKALSGGQRQRVALGRAIVRNPKVFLFDEPLSNLDANLRVQMRTEISRLHNRLQTTMIYVTHDQVEAMSMGDRIVVIKDGIMQQADTPLTIYNNPANRFVAGFIGSPTMNFVEGRLSTVNGYMFEDRYGYLKLPLKDPRYEHLQRLPQGELTLGIRPECITSKPQNDFCQKVTVSIDVTEPIGNEIFLYFTIGSAKEQYVSRIPADTEPQVGRPFDLFFDLSKLHFFDQNTGAAL